MTTYTPAALRQLVSQRAAGACEYCLIHQTFSMYSHEVDQMNETSRLQLRQSLAAQGLYPDLPSNIETS
jgi:5-methylcytosine-specific restriction endonuclease McrA